MVYEFLVPLLLFYRTINIISQCSILYTTTLNYILLIVHSTKYSVEDHLTDMTCYQEMFNWYVNLC